MTIQSHTELAARARSFAESQESIAEVLMAGSSTFVSRNRAGLAQNTANILRELAAALESPTPPERVQGEEGARIWIDQSETSQTQVVGKLLQHVPDEYLVTAERDNEDDDWYIRVTNSGGYKDYDDYWRSSARKTADEVMIEAARGAMVPLAPTPPTAPAQAPQAATAGAEPRVFAGWLVTDSEGNDDFINNPTALAGRTYKGREPLLLEVAALRASTPAARVPEFDHAALYRAMDLASMLAGSVGMNAVELSRGYANDLRAHLSQFIVTKESST